MDFIFNILLTATAVTGVAAGVVFLAALWAIDKTRTSDDLGAAAYAGVVTIISMPIVFIGTSGIMLSGN